MTQRLSISRGELKELYEKKKLTTYQIAEKLDCCQGTIWKRLKEFKIKRRKPHELNSNIPSREILINLYKNKKLSTWEIEKKHGYCRGTVHRKLKEFKIGTRGRAESHISFPRKNFSGNLIEKAYIIGFRIGDLGVRKIHPGSKTICVASGSTKIEQIELIKGLFENYGPVWIQKLKNGKMNIQANLDESFNFLVSKETPRWVTKTKKAFFSFLAGFTDAEGHIGIHNGMAQFSLGNYDYNLLKLIDQKLKKFGLKINFFSDKRKGKKNNEGYIYRDNYHSIRIYKKEDLLVFFKEVGRYMKHKNKIEDLKKAKDNIIRRNKKWKNKKQKTNFILLLQLIM
jgi:hypothetical protein